MNAQTQVGAIEFMSAPVPETIAAATQAPDSLEAALARDYSRIRRLARSFGIIEADLDDAAQEVFAKAWTGRRNFDQRASFSTWVTRIALNHFSTMLKRQRRRVRSQMEIWEREGEIENTCSRRLPDPCVQAQAKEAYALASGCIGRLSRKQREAFVLRYLEEMNYAEVAVVLKISEGAARARAFEARTNLRQMLREYDL